MKLQTALKALSFYNTLTKRDEPFSPIVPGQVLLYCCGPTVYHFAHIGNLRAYIFEDTLVRCLRSATYNVRHVMNITDVGHLTGDNDIGEDKMLLAMRREGKTANEIAAFYTQAFFNDCRKLNLQEPNVICKATEHISDMIGLIQKLEKLDLTYFANGNVYFDTAKIPDYGKLIHGHHYIYSDLQNQEDHSRVETDLYKKNSRDFVLWFTNSKFENHEMNWDSPWGRGYPGWHIECSAMALRYLGEQIDIHCGGIDHIPIHHTNEIAQSEGATGKQWVNTWLHSEFLIDQEGKMSKSRGDFLTLDLLEQKGFDPLDYKYFIFGTHYHSQLKFTYQALSAAQTSLNKLRDKFIAASNSDTTAISLPSDTALKIVEEIGSAMSANLSTPKVLATIWQTVRNSSVSPSDLVYIGVITNQLLGLDLFRQKKFTEAIPTHVMQLAQERFEARSRKDWKRADELRKLILDSGYLVEDKGKSFQLTKKS
ncbi:MAG TPA: cysteine--tRNA ligase [Oligoflexia bacterium]|nr:cysteine--tRNA ligase [Oligoflexia bacterium]HMP27073.1 cysteine--tRNA ligase [Oligoflexia bacterium]